MKSLQDVSKKVSVLPYSRADASLQDVTLYQILDQLGNDSTYSTNRYNLTPTKGYSYTLKGTYTEPLAQTLFLQMSYSYAHSFSKSDRSTYDFSRLDFSAFEPEYRQWGFLPYPLDSYLDSELSRYSEYTTDTHEAALQLRKVGKKWNYTAGIMLQPQRSHYVQDYQGVSVDTVRTTLNFSPTLDLRYKISKVSQLTDNRAFLGVSELDWRLSDFYFALAYVDELYGEFMLSTPTAFTRWIHSPAADFTATRR